MNGLLSQRREDGKRGCFSLRRASLPTAQFRHIPVHDERNFISKLPPLPLLLLLLLPLESASRRHDSGIVEYFRAGAAAADGHYHSRQSWAVLVDSAPSFLGDRL